MNNNNTSLLQERAFRYNNSGSSRNFYADFEYREGDKGAIIAVITVSGAVNCIRRFDLIKGQAIHFSTIQQGSGGTGYNGEVLLNSSGSQTTGSDAVTFVLLNVQPYAEVELYAGNIALTRSYFA